MPFLDFEGYKADLEQAASAALGMEVHVTGRLGVGFLPNLHVAIQDVHVRNRDTDVAAVKLIRVGIDIAPLLHREVRVDGIALQKPRFYVARNRDGTFNFETSQTPQRLPAVDAVRITISEGTLIYEDKKSGDRIEAGGCKLATSRLRLVEGSSKDLLKHLSLAAELACLRARVKNFPLFDLKASIAGNNGVFEIEPITLRLFHGLGSGRVRADFRAAASTVDVHYSLSQLRIEEFFKTVSPQKVGHGALDFTLDLKLHGSTTKDLKRSATGIASLRGANLTLDGTDLDRALAKYESSQNFNLLDVGAIALAGPIGLVATKGFGLANAVQEAPGSTRIATLVSDWIIKRGVARATDVAMATPENRIAVKGRLDFVNERFDNVVVAVVDAKGCVKVRQTLRGPFDNPALDKPGIFASLAGPLINLISKPASGWCTVFYAGSVAPPK